MTIPPPIACTLAPGDYTGRVHWIADLNRSALRAHRQTDRMLELTYERGAADRVRELVRQEQRCCAFLRFALDETPDAIRLVIEAPPDAGDGSAALFAPFLSGASGHAGKAIVDGAGSSRIASVAATSGAAAAVACGVCCVLPFALPAVAATTLGSVIAAFAGVYRWAVILAIALVAAGWLWVGWQSLRARRRPARSTVRAMGVATLLLGVALSWPFLEPRVIAALKG